MFDTSPPVTLSRDEVQRWARSIATFYRQHALPLPWCELAETFLPHDPASAERLMRRALVVTR